MRRSVEVITCDVCKVTIKGASAEEINVEVPEGNVVTPLKLTFGIRIRRAETPTVDLCLPCIRKLLAGAATQIDKLMERK